jgi:hypothetical protein
VINLTNIEFIELVESEFAEKHISKDVDDAYSDLLKLMARTAAKVYLIADKIKCDQQP